MENLDFLSTLNDNLLVKSVDELKNEIFIADLSCGKIKFLTVVESIQGVLTNENINVRERGVEFLSWILIQAPVDLFNGAEINVIVNFYCNCLKGHHNLLPAVIKGLLAVVKMKNVSAEEVVKILQQLFQQVNCRTQLQEDRYNIFCILKLIIENYIEDVKQLGPDFVFGLISFIEGETDPTNLLLIFNFLPFFIRNFELGHLAEEMFELLSCYFPVDFNSATKENCLMTREDLAQGLAECLSASHEFCQLCLPLIFEKLDSSFKTAKLDSYNLLEKCCHNLKAEGLENHLNELWKSIQKDILPGNDAAVCETGLLALTSVITLLSKEEIHSTAFSSFVNDIITTVKSFINKVDDNMFQPAMKALMAISSPSKIVTAQVLRHLTSCYYINSRSTIMERKIILSTLLPFLKCCHAHRISSNVECDVLTSYNELVNLYLDSTGFPDYEVRKLAFAGVHLLLPDFNQDYRAKLYEIIVDNIKTKEDINSSEELLNVWRSLAVISSTEFHKVLTKDFQISTTGTEMEPHTLRFLWALSFVADIPTFSGLVIPIFINMIVNSHHYLVGLENVLNACKYAKVNESEDFFHILHAEHNILECLISWWLAFHSKDSEKAGAVILILSEIIARLVRSQSAHSQQNIVDSFIGMFLNDSLPILNGGGSFNVPTKDSVTNSCMHNQMVLILEAILGSVRPEIIVPEICTIQEKLTSLSLTSFEDLIRLASSRLLASLVNKSKEPLSSELVTRITKDIFTQLEESADRRLKRNCSFLFTWVMKGLILKGGQEFENWVLTWFDLLGRTDVGEGIAEGFRTITEEDDLYLSLESHCNVKILYRQRLFGYFPKLMKMYETSEPLVKMNYLLALILLLQGVPNHLIETEISSIAILLVQCLNTDKMELLMTALEILTGLLESRKKIFSDYIQSFVPRFLMLAKCEGYMKIRMNALKCLYYYGFYPTVVLLPFKNQVTRGIECCLDDKKRLVRKDAVRARCRWFLVGSPGEDILES